jgi:hypothetical protein
MIRALVRALFDAKAVGCFLPNLVQQTEVLRKAVNKSSARLVANKENGVSCNLIAGVAIAIRTIEVRRLNQQKARRITHFVNA